MISQKQYLSSISKFQKLQSLLLLNSKIMDASKQNSRNRVDGRRIPRANSLNKTVTGRK